MDIIIIIIFSSHLYGKVSNSLGAITLYIILIIASNGKESLFVHLKSRPATLREALIGAEDFR